MLLRYIQSRPEQVKIARACHVDPTAGNMGKSRTIFRIKERYMWHGVCGEGCAQPGKQIS